VRADRAWLLPANWNLESEVPGAQIITVVILRFVNPLPDIPPENPVRNQVQETARAIGDGVVDLAGEGLVEVVIELAAAALEVLGNL
jgi:hypothetical protein